ncbi:MAG: AbrB/MazE/SpoVT family DNA-binding domain-containing protein [Promethearchaeota archaeon]
MARVHKNTYVYGTVKVGERGQIVIPKEARKAFNIEPGDILLVVGDLNRGIGITKVDRIKGLAAKVLGTLGGASLEEEPVEEEK